MGIKSRIDRKLFVLDTNVLMHDPTAIFRFAEHDIFIPMAVLEELDRSKKGTSEVARNTRQVSRCLNELMDPEGNVSDGIELPHINSFRKDNDVEEGGLLFFQTKTRPVGLPDTMPGNLPDNNIIGTTLALIKDMPERKVILVSKDINMRIKAGVLGIKTEDYSNDQVLDDINLLYTGLTELPIDFWDTHSKDLESWQEEGRTFYRVNGPNLGDWYPNQSLHIPGDEPFEAIVRKKDEAGAVIEMITDYRNPKHAVWGINALNREQNFALNLLMDREVDFVSIIGKAGTGKTLLALAVGLAQTLDHNLYKEIIMTRATVPVGDDIGFLPGTEEEKMAPWMGALMDNLEVLTQTEGGEWGKTATGDLLRSRIRIHSLNFMRGRTFLKKYIIIDEAQNLTSKQMKTLVTRAGPGTKVVCLGNVAQIDTPYLTETNSGLTYVVDRFKDWPHSGHLTLLRGERSRLADYANEAL